MIYGPNTPSVQAIIDRISTLTKDEIDRLNAAIDATRDATWGAAYDAASEATWPATRHPAWGAAMEAAYDAAWDATWAGSWEATWAATRHPAWKASWNATRDAALATVTYDLATEDGSYTIAERDLLLAPWVSVCGMPEGLVAMDGEA